MKRNMNKNKSLVNKKMKRNRILLALLGMLLLIIVTKGIVYNGTDQILYKDYILQYSKEYRLNPYLVMAIIKTESNFDKDAISPKGAMGLMQITESTAEWVAESTGTADFEIHDLYDPETNIKMGCWYINKLREEFGTTELILAAYNAGPGNVDEWLKDSDISKDGQKLDNIPFVETDNYIKKVLSNEEIYQHLNETN